MARAKEKPLHVEMAAWVQHHLGDKNCFAPFTGQDYPAWKAFVYGLQCYSAGGGADAIDLLRAAVRAAQPTKAVLQVFIQTIPGVLDWGYVSRLWVQIVSSRSSSHAASSDRPVELRGGEPVMGLVAYESDGERRLRKTHAP